MYTTHRHPSDCRSVEKDRCGTAVVETAVISPIFFMIVLAICEFGRAMSVTQLLTTATRDGCRKAIIEGQTTSDVLASVEAFINETISPDPNSVVISIEVDRPQAENLIEKARPGDLVTVRASVPMHAVQYFAGEFLSDSVFSASCSMIHE